MLGMTFDIQTHLALLAVSGTGSLSGLPTTLALHLGNSQKPQTVANYG
jgi:hypothetical protein